MEITNADIKQFIRYVTSCGYYNRKIIGINNDLENIRNEMTGIKSLAPKNYVIENKRPFSLQKLNSLIVDEEKLIISRDYYQQRILEVDYYFSKLPLEIQEIMIKIYIVGMNHERTARIYHLDRSTLYRNINKEIKKILAEK